VSNVFERPEDRMPDDFEMPFPQYRCPTCGEDLPLTEARLTVTCATHQPEERVEFAVREASPSDRNAIGLICDRALGESEVDIFGGTYDVLESTNFVAETDGKFAGLLSARIIEGDLAVILLSVYPDYQGKGVGRALLSYAHGWAGERGLPAIRVAVSNDDIPQLYFYQRHGFLMSDIVVGAVVDKLGAAIPGFSGIPARDEIHLRRAICS
jgi:GNAT superfamily N-acetyltransferase